MLFYLSYWNLFIKGMDDDNYKTIFEPVIKGIFEYFKPEAVVL
jgi:acetoin utilization deacetylase AcuC-like enzyme